MFARLCCVTAVMCFAAQAFAQVNFDRKLKVDETLPGRSKQDETAPDQPDPPPSDSKAAFAQFEATNGLKIGTDDEGRVVIESITAKGEAASAGIKEGDRIIEIDGKPIGTTIGLTRYLVDQREMSAHFLRLQRGEKKIEVALGKRLEMLGMTVFGDKSKRPLVRKVEKGSAADRAGIHQGDLISGISGRSIESMQQFTDFAIPLIRKMSEGQEIPLRLVRDGDEIDVAVIRPEDAALPLIPAPAETTRTAPIRRVIKEKTRQAPVAGTTVINDDNDDDYLNGLAGFGRNTDGGGGSLALDFSNDIIGNSGSLQPIGNVSSVSATLHPMRSQSLGTLSGSNRHDSGIQSPSVMSAGFVLVQSDGTQTIVNARVAGFSQGEYRLVVHEFGDCGDILNGSAGQAAVTLGTISVNQAGRGALQTSITNVEPQLLVGRVVSVSPSRTERVPAGTRRVAPQNQPPTQAPNNSPAVPQSQSSRNRSNSVSSAEDSASVMTVAATSPQFALAQKGNGRPFGNDTPNSPIPANPAGPNQPRRPFGPDTPNAPRPGDPQNPQVPGTPTDGTLDPLGNAINRDNFNLGNATTVPRARHACGVFGVSNPQRPILPLDTTNPVNSAVPADPGLQNNGTLQNNTLRRNTNRGTNVNPGRNSNTATPN